jgi:hypothetical protein
VGGDSTRAIAYVLLAEFNAKTVPATMMIAATTAMS